MPPKPSMRGAQPSTSRGLGKHCSHIPRNLKNKIVVIPGQAAKRWKLLKRLEELLSRRATTPTASQKNNQLPAEVLSAPVVAKEETPISVELLMFFEQSRDSVTASASALHSHYLRRGFRVTSQQGRVVQEPFRRSLGRAVKWFEVLQVAMEHHVDAALVESRVELPEADQMDVERHPRANSSYPVDTGSNPSTSRSIQSAGSFVRPVVKNVLLVVIMYDHETNKKMSPISSRTRLLRGIRYSAGGATTIFAHSIFEYCEIVHTD